jgi:hypothetical protein
MPGTQTQEIYDCVATATSVDLLLTVVAIVGCLGSMTFTTVTTSSFIHTPSPEEERGGRGECPKNFGTKGSMWNNSFSYFFKFLFQ